MSPPTLRILAYLALALTPFANGAEANVGGLGGGALSVLGRSSPMYTVQFNGGDCWYDNGWNGPGWYQCGNEWNNGLGWIGPVDPAFVPATRRHHRHGVIVANPRAPNSVYPSAPAPHPGMAGHPSVGLNRGAPAFGGNPGLRRFGAAGVRAAPNFHAGVATGAPGFGGGLHGGLGAGNFHAFHGAGVPHIGAPASPGFAGGGGLHGLGAATGVHIGAPASPGFAGVAGFHGGGGVGSPHIGAPVSPGFAGAGGGFHGFGGGAGFRGGGAAIGQGGIGHR
jgi:hypothetical protein